jgi:hypothetical protein
VSFKYFKKIFFAFQRFHNFTTVSNKKRQDNDSDDGVDDIDKKKHRIEEINKKLTVLRGKK